MKKFFCEMYVKIYTDGYPSIYGKIPPETLYAYLVDDMGACYDGDSQLPGDHRLWYFGCNEKFGVMRIVLGQKTFVRRWGMGEASFKNVRDLLAFCLENKIFDQQQHDRLSRITGEGETINDMYRIGDYLAAKASGRVAPATTQRKESEYAQRSS
ncbi:hypothetical protein [Desulfosudis oleivorans]|uniref:Uncharacterized protein n=1 Tax=Desulfosudis oleivorans (strain DSM 6200 / JCM 39069 / Hxd3) TaxID=96561 RepID=A8ZYJ2_DESOH|nr:hypothetical protein [Desulfosudis oleivorans]ABW68717.1 hypothetical protein Dole_2914 [Desulfosudis oleivorans Hxd3]